MRLDNETALYITTSPPVSLPTPSLSYTIGENDFELEFGASAMSNLAITNTGEEGSELTYSVSISGIDGNYSIIKMISGEVRKIDSKSMATIGILSNPDQKNIKIGKAGRSRWLGRRPHTRGVVKNPVDHPHGGGEGKSAGGRHPVSPTGQSAKGLKTRDNKRTDKFIIRRRKKKRK